ncbi:MAG: BamA/TamA family outer membrane protein [Candidatus Competibacteraceae bacterium]
MCAASIFRGIPKLRMKCLRWELRQTEGSCLLHEGCESFQGTAGTVGLHGERRYETEKVPGALDQVDIDYKITEQASGNVLSVSATAKNRGILLNASVNQSNFLGTGNQLNVTFNNSNISTVYSIAYNNPYYTLDGISRGFRLYYRERDASESNTADYLLDDYGAEINYGFPLTEDDTLRVGLGFEGGGIGTQRLRHRRKFSILSTKTAMSIKISNYFSAFPETVATGLSFRNAAA